MHSYEYDDDTDGLLTAMVVLVMWSLGCAAVGGALVWWVMR